MVLRFFIFAAAFLISCTSEERDSVCDEKSIYYNGCVGGISSSSGGNVPSSSSKSVSHPSYITHSDPVPYGDQIYQTIFIGTQIWMARNLNYNKSGSKCYGEGIGGVSADSIAKNCERYGRLYNWETARTACPDGWHLPSDTEWEELVNFVGYSTVAAGTQLKAESGWNSDDDNGQDWYGFAAMPGGYGTADGIFAGEGYYAGWWSSTAEEQSRAHHRSILSRTSGNDNTIINKDSYEKSSLCSVRCVKGY
ncbi:MAG: hypothetical protein LBC75_13975 [Fibromonadaceae bacterium]|jgi:uncharacterized protein (TIGR02145 family)|nr:hypothetical protein [Fibromonadaceae bacterium]